MFSLSPFLRMGSLSRSNEHLKSTIVGPLNGPPYREA